MSAAQVLSLPFSSRPAEHLADGGFVRLYRRLFEEGDSVLGDDRRLIGAWIEMICRAAWKPHDVRIGESWIKLRRGQLIIDYRRWAKRWGLSPTKFHDACKRMQKSGRVRLMPERVDDGLRTTVTVLTICNYDAYQAPSDDVGTASEQPPNTDRKKGKKVRIVGSEFVGSTESPLEAPDGAVDEIDLDALLYRRGKTLLGARAAGQITRLKSCLGVAKALEAIEAARRKENPVEYVAGIIRNHQRKPLTAAERVAAQGGGRQGWEIERDHHRFETFTSAIARGLCEDEARAEAAAAGKQWEAAYRSRGRPGAANGSAYLPGLS